MFPAELKKTTEQTTFPLRRQISAGIVLFMNTTNSIPKTAADDIREMMNAWNKIETAARREFPGASEERIYQISANAMRYALGIK